MLPLNYISNTVYCSYSKSHVREARVFMSSMDSILCACMIHGHFYVAYVSITEISVDPKGKSECYCDLHFGMINCGALPCRHFELGFQMPSQSE